MTVYNDDLSKVIIEHSVTWSRKDTYCKDQYVKEQPEEFPTAPVASRMVQLPQPQRITGFEKFNFGKAGDCNG